MARWVKTYPETKVDLELLSSKVIIEKLKRGTVDAAILYSEIISENINIYRIKDQEVVLVSHPNVPKLSSQNYNNLEFVSYNDDDVLLQSVLKRHLQKRKLANLNIKFQCQSHFSIRNFLLEYPAIGALPRSLVEEDIKSNRLSLVSKKVEVVHLYLAVNNMEFEPEKIKTLRQFLRKQLN